MCTVQYSTVLYRCGYCKEELGQAFHVSEESLPCCGVCHRERAHTCTVCQAKILEDLVECRDKFYHPACMKVCVQCSVWLAGYREIPPLVLCVWGAAV